MFLFQQTVSDINIENGSAVSGRLIVIETAGENINPSKKSLCMY